MICTDCHRHLKNPPVMIGGLPYGPKCAKTAKPVQTVERDLFYSAEQVSAEIANRHLAEMRVLVWQARQRCGVEG